MILLRLISWPYARKHLARCLLTGAGIVLGVAVFVAMRTANQSVLAAFRETIDRIAGATQLQVSAGEAGFDEEILDKVRAVRGVRAAAPVIEASVATGSGNLLLLGVDMLGDRNLRTYDLEDSDASIDDPLVFLAQPDSLMITKPYAQKRNLQNGSRISMKTMAGDRTFTVRGIMKPGGLASAFGGDLAVMDIYAAQKILGRGRRFDRVDLALDEGVTLNEATRTLQDALGPGFQVAPPSSRGEQFEATARVYSLGSNITSLFALFIGMFIIYNTFAIAVTQRRSEIGILRALGATRRQIRALFLTESAFTGLAGTLIGIFLGMLMARGMAGYIGGLLEQIYGSAQRAGDIALEPGMFFAAMAMGLLTSVIAALLPANAAARVDPVKALQKGRYQSLSEGESRTRRNFAIVFGLLCVAALIFSHIGIVFYAGFVLAVAAAILLCPMLSLWVARALRPLLAKISPVEGALAADSLIQAPRRTSGTVAALMLALALVISLGGIARSSYVSISEWMKIALDPDFFVTTAESITSRDFTFPSSLADKLRAIEGVGDLQMVRSIRLQVKNAPVLLIAIDIPKTMPRLRLPPIEGNSDTMYREVSSNRGVMASENFAQLHGAKLGEILEIPAPYGTLRLPVVGVVRDFSDQQGSLVISRDVFNQYWRDDRVNLFRVYLKPGAQGSEVRERIVTQLGSEQRLFVLTNKDVRDFIVRLTDQWFGLTYVQIAVAVLVAVLGIVNALTVSITDRRRELGVLQAVGGLRQQVRTTVWLEAAAIGLIGLVLGLAMGAVQLYYTLEVTRRDLVGVDYGYTYPFGMALTLVPVILGAAFLAALGPAERAVRGSLVEALEYE
jgi:putative ABC transport system permease protein